jgi:hypothetical protein
MAEEEIFFRLREKVFFVFPSGQTRQKKLSIKNAGEEYKEIIKKSYVF